jgi:hypothetical protein
MLNCNSTRPGEAAAYSMQAVQTATPPPPPPGAGPPPPPPRKTGTGRSAASGHASRRKRRKGASLPPTSICTPLLRTHGDVTDDRHDRCKQLTIEPFWALFFFCNSSLAQKRVSAKMWQSCPAAAAVAVLLYRVAQRFRDKCLIIKLIDKTLFKAFNFPVE